MTDGAKTLAVAAPMLTEAEPGAAPGAEAGAEPGAEVPWGGSALGCDEIACKSTMIAVTALGTEAGSELGLG